MSEEWTISTKFGLMTGVPLDPDQLILKYCSFEVCRVSGADEPLYLLVYEGRVMAVCEKCYRSKLRRGTP